VRDAVFCPLFNKTYVSPRLVRTIVAQKGCKS
jgi:hypothetical protein